MSSRECWRKLWADQGASPTAQLPWALMSGLKDKYTMDHNSWAQHSPWKTSCYGRGGKAFDTVWNSSCWLVFCKRAPFVLYARLLSWNMNKDTFCCNFSISLETFPEKMLWEGFGARIHCTWYCAGMPLQQEWWALASAGTTPSYKTPSLQQHAFGSSRTWTTKGLL